MSKTKQLVDQGVKPCCWAAFEFGFQCAEKGMNLQAALLAMSKVAEGDVVQPAIRIDGGDIKTCPRCQAVNNLAAVVCRFCERIM